ncbi:hypothetical protein [Nocardia lasii]|uniref:FUSC family protein n=1 Tax=Nocardia lasii TaxID=1616107 RepID=A0ABW1JVN9_9NOCA
MPKLRDVVDAATAFTGAIVAGMALFLPFTFSTADSIGSPYRVTSLVNSVPRAAALGLIVAACVAVMVRPLSRPGLVWLTATCGSAVLTINYFIGRNVTSADILTTQNYIDALSGGFVFGALGICSLRQRWPAVGFALGTVLVFVYGEVVAVFSANVATANKVVHTPAWMVVLATILLIVNTVRHRHGIMLPTGGRQPADLPISPIVGATVLSLTALLATEWLSNEFDGQKANVWEIALAVLASVGAAFLAAILLPGRDGAGVLIAIAVAAAADALGDAQSLGWAIVLVAVLATTGILVGLARPAPWLVLLGAGVISVYSIFAAGLEWMSSWVIGVAMISYLAGFGFGSVRVTYLPSAILALGALYLPSILWAIPTALRTWPVGGPDANAATPGRTALAITAATAVALLLLYRIRPAATARRRPVSAPDT